MKTIKPLLFATAICLSGAGIAAAQTPVPVQPFTGIQLKGGGKVIVRYGPRQQVSLLSGSTQFTRIETRSNGWNRNQLVINACNARCPHRYDLVVEITVPRLTPMAVDGGGAIEVRPGFPRTANTSIAVNGGGLIDLRAVQAANTSAAVNGGGKIQVGATRSLSAAISGGGLITYRGNPQTSTAINGGGRVTQEG